MELLLSIGTVALSRFHFLLTKQQDNEYTDIHIIAPSCMYSKSTDTRTLLNVHANPVIFTTRSENSMDSKDHQNISTTSKTPEGYVFTRESISPLQKMENHSPIVTSLPRLATLVNYAHPSNPSSLLSTTTP